MPFWVSITSNVMGWYPLISFFLSYHEIFLLTSGGLSVKIPNK